MHIRQLAVFPGQHLRYRPDIDGLRAVAVLGVFAFHARLLQGGFTGVDIFFVISGWLISSLIVNGADKGDFSLAEFYRRRIVRILPALWVMMLAVLGWGYRNLYANEFKHLASAALATCLSGSNIYFYKVISYFDVNASYNPLLHTWSLGVEEQFYIVYPLLILLITKYVRRSRMTALCILAVISLVVSTWLTYTNPNGGFYLPHSRAWELLLGGILANSEISFGKRGARELLALCGMAGIGVSFLRFNGNMPFPGIAALLPCVSAGLLMVAGRSGPSIVMAPLSSRPVVFIGLISYSLYLWHLPLIVMQRLGGFVQIGHSPVVNRALVVLSSFVLAVLSWWLIERPFREVSPGWTRSRRAALAAGGMVFTGLLTVWVFVSGGVPSRFSAAVNQAASFLDYDPVPSMRAGKCFLLDLDRFEQYDKAFCLAEKPGRRSYLLLGDSHGGHLYPGLEAVLGERDNILQANCTGCKPLLRDRAGERPCARMNRFVYDSYLPSHKVDAVILSARWEQGDYAGVVQTVAWLRARQIRAIVVGPSAEYDVVLPRLLAMSLQRNEPGLMAQHVVQRYAVVNDGLGPLVRAAGAEYLDIYKILCPSSGCVTYSDGVPVMFDTGHLTKSGAVFVVRALTGNGAVE